MENLDKTFNSLCRVCLQHVSLEEMVSLLDRSEHLSHYGKALETITKIFVLENRYLPIKMCEKCRNFLGEIAAFKERSKNNHRKLCKVIDFSLKKDLSENLIKEVVNQYSIFNHNHPDEEKEGIYYINHLSEDTFNSDNLKVKSEYPDIKVELDIENISQNDGISSEMTDKTDNVDVFLYSVDKLLQLSSEINQNSPKKPHKAKNKRTPVDLTCNLCQKVLANPITYKRHIERHGKSQYVCDQCGKDFPVLAELKSHQIYRHGHGSTFICDICSFKAAHKFELIEHIRLHTGERPFTCEKCGLTFRRKAVYKTHLVSHGEKTIQCQYCSKKFFRRSDMLLHVNNKHDRRYLFKCSVCNITYAKDYTVKRHMLDKHGIKKGKVLRVYKNMDASYFKDRKDKDTGKDEEFVINCS